MRSGRVNVGVSTTLNLT